LTLITAAVDAALSNPQVFMHSKLIECVMKFNIWNFSFGWHQAVTLFAKQKWTEDGPFDYSQDHM